LREIRRTGHAVPDQDDGARIHIQPGYLKRWIENPQGIRYNTTMPGLAREIPRREQVIEDLIAYLKAMSGAKRDPLQPE
jgi:cytochrome c1